MLRGTKENRSFRALTLKHAGMVALCFLLLASTIVAVIPQANLLHSTLAPAAYAQETDTGEAEETDTGEAEETDTGDSTAPTVTSTEPVDGATDVPVTLTSITATFSELVQGVDDTTFTIDGITGEVTYDSQSNTATFTPSENLAFETEYIASLSSAITDAAGNPLTATEWSFTTAAEGDEEVPLGEVPLGEVQSGEEDDTTAPTVTSTEPVDGATDVPVTLTSITATFSELVQGVDDTTFTVSQGDTAVEGTVAYDSQSNTATFTPSENLAFETEYIASLSSAITDAAGNPLTATEWSFTTAAEGDEEVPLGEEVQSGGGTDPSGVDELYATASGGPTWYISEQEDPTSEGHFYLSMYSGSTIGYSGSGIWNVDATSGTQEHGIRMHVDSPSGSWTNTEMTGYFKALSGSDQFTMIARHGPSYQDDNGCQAYGYYGMTTIDGNVFFKKKLYHFNDGYTKRLAQVDALSSLSDNRWIGMKFVVYDLSNGDVKLELWIDDGDMTNNWRKVSELVDSGNHAVEGGDDCGRQATDTIDSGTRVTYRVDNMEFDFKKLSAREIEPPNGAETSAVAAEPQEEETSGSDEPQGDEQTSGSDEPQGDEQTSGSDEG